jgi:hypothetical protein
MPITALLVGDGGCRRYADTGETVPAHSYTTARLQLIGVALRMCVCA